MNRQPDTVAIGVIALGVLLALNSLLGPLAFDVIEYRYGPSMINQAIGLDAVALAVATPLAVAAGILIRRGHRAGPVLAMAPALFAAYMMPQYLIGPDYLNLPGNNETSRSATSPCSSSPSPSRSGHGGLWIPSCSDRTPARATTAARGSSSALRRSSPSGVSYPPSSP
jgi:hypothetical protein